MRNWKFRIKFSGLTSFVMRPEPDSPGAKVFLPNALKCQDKRHEPELRFDQRDVTTSPWKIPEPNNVINSPHYHYRKIWQLRFVDLYFLPAPDVTLRQNFVLDQSIHDYLPNFTTIFPQASVINGNCFATSPPNDLVVIRVPLRHGNLRATKLAFEQLNQIVNCEFAPKGNTAQTIYHTQKCAIEVSLEFKVEEGPLTLVGVPFGHYPSSGIAFVPPAGKTEVVVELENRPIDTEKTTLVSENKRRDDDYSLHYDLSESYFPDDERIVPIFPINLESGNCILGRFADNSGA